MSKNSYAEVVSNSKLKAGAVRAHQAELTARGLDEAYSTAFEAGISDTESKNTQQEAKKADLKAATTAVLEALDKLRAKNSEIDKLVKLTLPKDTWVEFGITAKR